MRFALVVLAACGATPWHVPPGYKHETIAFPLDALASAATCGGV
jgi:hypothetical protein